MKEDRTEMGRNRPIKYLCAYNLEKEENREGKRWTNDGDATMLVEVNITK